MNEEVYISGVMDIEGKGYYSNGSPVLELIFKTKKSKGVKQVMNFGAVKFISSLGGGNPIKSIGSANFRYNIISGKVRIKDGYLTIEGLAGKKGDKYFLVKSGLFGGINISIDKRNTIKIEDLIRIITKQVGSFSTSFH
ncbi:MAG: hypothetical protein RBT05_10750 [Bacteroidales bacterium]|nr:hypothetical protein [Bacteroidales bacterium]